MGLGSFRGGAGCVGFDILDGLISFHLAWFFPWSIFLPLAVKLFPSPRTWWKQMSAEAQARLLLFVWFGVVFVFFSLVVGSRMEYYAFGGWPAVTILLGLGIARAEEQRNQWLPRLQLQHDDFRAALAWSGDHAAEFEARLTTALIWFWYFAGYISEARSHLEHALKRGAEIESAALRVNLRTDDPTTVAGSVPGSMMFGDFRQSGCWTPTARSRVTIPAVERIRIATICGALRRSVRHVVQN